MNITGELLRTLRTDIDDALKAVGEKNNVTLRAGNASFQTGSSAAHFKLEVVTVGSDGQKADIPAELFVRHAAMLGMKPDDLGKQITLQGRSFVVAGYNPKARKNCMIIRDAGGKTFVTTEAVIKSKLTAL